MVNKQGQTRLASYYEWFPIQERVTLEAEVTHHHHHHHHHHHYLILTITISDNKTMFVAHRISMFIYRISRI